MRSQFMASLLLCGLMVAAAQAQLMRLDTGSTLGAPSSCDCDGSWHNYGPDCGVAGPHAIECGGYGACDSCGVGGYFGRNIHPVRPCVCGGPLCRDVMRGIRRLLDTTLSCAIRTVFGGLNAVSCHAEGSLAALNCAATVGFCGRSCRGDDCGVCGGAGRGTSNYGAGRGTSTYSCSDLPPSVYGTPTYATPIGTSPIGPEPIAVPEDIGDPFTDDPVTPPEGRQARRIRHPVPAGYRYANPRTRARPTTYRQPVRGNVDGSAVQPARQSSVLKASEANNTARRRYFNGRPLTVRR